MIRSSVLKTGLIAAATASVVAGSALLGGAAEAPAAAMPAAWEQAQALDAEQAAASNKAVLKAEAERKAEAKAKKKAAAERRAAKAKAARARAAAGGTPAQNRALGMQMCADHGWSGSQCDDLAKLWQKESGWSSRAHNASSGAHGIPQALPGSKMGSHGSDWATSARTQIAWGLDYIADVYGNPSNAWGHSQRTGWY